MSEAFNNLIIFEMANNHQGSVEHGKTIIREMGKIARKYNVKAAVKLQYRNLDTFIHPDYKGRTDLPHIPRFESTRLTYEQFCALVDEIREEGMLTMSTPFDEDGVDWCMDQGLDYIKVASCSATDWSLLGKIAATKKKIIISTGGKTISDIDNIYNFFTHRECDFALLHCVAEYPVPEDHVQLDFMDKMKKRYKDIPLGYSGHEDPNDHIIPMMAVAKGATILERHVGVTTQDIKLNAYSLDPEQTDAWVRSIVTARNLCRMKGENEKYISQEELDSLDSLQRGVYVKHAIKSGEEITADDVFFAMPRLKGQMTASEFYKTLRATRDYQTNEAVYESKEATNVRLVRAALHDVKGLIYEAGIAVGNDPEIEISHHYGMKRFRSIGCTIVNVINREYCKKLIIVLPGQQHPTHYHKVKEETFQLLYGDLTCVVNDQSRDMKPGDIQTILRGDRHSFRSVNGAVFEEISTTHIKNDSYYEDDAIMKMDFMERKTVLKDW